MTTQPSSTGNCLAKKLCVMGQKYHHSSNTCNEPNCEAYYFMVLNEEYHTCQTVSLDIDLNLASTCYHFVLGNCYILCNCRVSGSVTFSVNLINFIRRIGIVSYFFTILLNCMIEFFKSFLTNTRISYFNHFNVKTFIIP